MLRTLPARSVHCCVTSPPYYALRDYGVDGQIGLEQTGGRYIERVREVFAEVYRVLRDDGTCWVNMGDTYGACKNIMGMPWRVAFALQEDGWILRQDIIWHKPCPMPESVRDRCCRAHDYLFLLTKRERYFFDHDAMCEPAGNRTHSRGGGANPKSLLYSVPRANGPNSRMVREHVPGGGRKPNASRANVQPRGNPSFLAAINGPVARRLRRSVWTIASRPYSGAHFAVFPPRLVEQCILPGSPKGGVILDPFAGSGTTGAVAMAHGRRAVLIELNPEYVTLIRERLQAGGVGKEKSS